MNGESVNISLEGKTCRKLSNEWHIYNSENNLTAGYHLYQPLGYIHVKGHSIHTCLLVYIPDLR